MQATATERQPLSAQQRQIYEFIRLKIREGLPPTLKEIAAAVGVKHQHQIRCQLQMMQHKGYIKHSANRSRALRLTDPDTFTCPSCGCRFSPAE